MSTTEQLLRNQLSTCSINAVKEGRAVRKILAGANIIEYGILEIRDAHKGELKLRANNAVKWALSVVKWLIGHPNAKAEHKEQFKEGYHDEKNALLSALFDTVYELNNNDLAMIIDSIKQHIDEKKEIHDTTNAQ